MNNAIIMNVDSLPLQIRERIHTKKVSVEEKNGSIILMPVQENNVDLWGLLGDGKFTTTKFLDQKRKDKELET